MSSPIPPSLLFDIVASLLHDAAISRYFSAAGLVVLLYDHLLTLGDEILLIWRAPPSWAKYLFLVNRYIVPALLLVIATEMCGFSVQFTRTSCQTLVILSSLTALVSLGIANILILRRLILLWEHNRGVKIFLIVGFLLSFSATFSLMLMTMLELRSGIVWSSWAGMCVSEKVSPLLVGVWASPMAFEIIVLIATCWNAFDRPMDESVTMTKALQRDGIVFFCALTILRAINLGLAITMKPELSILLVFFVWSMTTLVLNRSLLDSQKTEATERLRVMINNMPRNAAPFGIDDAQLQEFEQRYSVNGESSYELEEAGSRAYGLKEKEAFTPDLYDYPSFIYDGSSRSICLITNPPLTLDLGPSFSTLVSKPLKSIRKSRSTTSLSRAFDFTHRQNPVPPLPTSPNQISAYSRQNTRRARYDELPSDWSPPTPK